MLVILNTHPIQYHVPIWKSLASNNRVPFEVWYLTSHGVSPSLDIEFGEIFQWDIDLLEGYPYRFVPDPVPGQLGSFWGVGLGAHFRSSLISGAIKAVLVPGWNVRAYWEMVYFAHRAGIQVWMRGDSNDLKIDKGLRYIAKRWLLSELFSRVDHFLYVGEANRRLYCSYGIDGARLVPGPHCVDNAYFTAQALALQPQRKEIRRAWGIPEKSYCLLYAAKFIKKKRPLDLVAAVRLLGMMDTGRTYHILFVGAGQLGETVRQQCRVLYDADQHFRGNNQIDSQAPSASFTGFLNQSEVSKAYIAADALILASDTDETWGLVVNEAMACGLPCVVSEACGSAEDLVIPLDPRLTYPCGDVAALSNSIRWLAEHPVSRLAIDKRIARYDICETVAALEQLWLEIVVGCQERL